MKIEDLYNDRYVEFKNIIYSVDMIRLKTYISYNKFTEIEFRLASCWKKYVKKSFSSSKIQNFFYNYVIETEEGHSFWFGFLHNSENRQGKVVKSNGVFSDNNFNFTIEFNPNKLKDFFMLFYFLGMGEEWYIVSYDLSFDLKVNICDLIWDMNGKRVEKIDNFGFDNKTIYIGTGDGRVKIYNKKKESNLEITGDLTRVELSRSGDDFEVRKMKIWRYDGFFPCIYLNQYVYSLSDYKNKTLLAILYAVQNGYPLRDLSRDYKAKIKKLLEGGYKIEFDSKIIEKIMLGTILNYFKGNNIHWW